MSYSAHYHTLKKKEKKNISEAKLSILVCKIQDIFNIHIRKRPQTSLHVMISEYVFQLPCLQAHHKFTCSTLTKMKQSKKWPNQFVPTKLGCQELESNLEKMFVLRKNGRQITKQIIAVSEESPKWLLRYRRRYSGHNLRGTVISAWMQSLYIKSHSQEASGTKMGKGCLW